MRYSIEFLSSGDSVRYRVWDGTVSFRIEIFQRPPMDGGASYCRWFQEIEPRIGYLLVPTERAGDGDAIFAAYLEYLHKSGWRSESSYSPLGWCYFDEDVCLHLKEGNHA